MSKSNPLYSFQNFLVSKSNEFAFTVAKVVAESPGAKYNPVYFYGPIGSGKTHLLNAVFNSIVKKGHINAALYTSEELLIEFVKSICARKLKNFEKMLKGRSALLIDDIQLFKERFGAQEALNSIFKDMAEKKIQIVLSGNVFPKDLDGFDKDFIGWMESGIVADIGQHDQELKQAFIIKTMDENKIKMPEDIVSWLSRMRISDLRTLHGAVMRLGAISDIKGTDITLEMSREALKDLIKEDDKTVLSIKDVQENIDFRRPFYTKKK